METLDKRLQSQTLTSEWQYSFRLLFLSLGISRIPSSYFLRFAAPGVMALHRQTTLSKQTSQVFQMTLDELQNSVAGSGKLASMNLVRFGACTCMPTSFPTPESRISCTFKLKMTTMLPLWTKEPCNGSEAVQSCATPLPGMSASEAHERRIIQYVMQEEFLSTVWDQQGGAPALSSEPAPQQASFPTAGLHSQHSGTHSDYRYSSGEPSTSLSKPLHVLQS